MYAFLSMNTPIGPICLAEDPMGIFCVYLGPCDAAFLSSLTRMTKVPHSAFEDSGPYVSQLKAELEAYFDGRLTQFTVPLSLYGTDFQKAVWQAIYEVPYGALSTYGDLAKQIGRPKASRAIGGATGKNPIPIVVPCHRIVGASGALTGFSAPGGLATKIQLLKREGIHYEL